MPTFDSLTNSGFDSFLSSGFDSFGDQSDGLIVIYEPESMDFLSSDSWDEIIDLYQNTLGKTVEKVARDNWGDRDINSIRLLLWALPVGDMNVDIFARLFDGQWKGRFVLLSENTRFLPQFNPIINLAILPHASARLLPGSVDDLPDLGSVNTNNAIIATSGVTHILHDLTSEIEPNESEIIAWTRSPRVPWMTSEYIGKTNFVLAADINWIFHPRSSLEDNRPFWAALYDARI